MEQKHCFVSLATTGRFTLTELCADFHVSRKTGHKWLVRLTELQLALASPRAGKNCSVIPRR